MAVIVLYCAREHFVNSNSHVTGPGTAAVPVLLYWTYRNTSVMGLIFIVAAHGVLCFGFVTKIMLTVRKCVSCY